MKKIFYTLITAFTFYASAQETTHNDALRYALDDLNGTARFRGMSGAFGAVGGDLSALNINPAGSVIFKYNTASITLNNQNNCNNSTYFGTKEKDRNNSFDLNQIGAVFVFENTEISNPWKKFSMAINYDKTHNFSNELFSKGINPHSSISNYFLNYAQGQPLEYLQTLPGESISSLYTYLGETSGLGFPSQQAMLGYQAYLYNEDVDDPENVTYTSNVPNGGNYYQENYINTDGYNGKISGNFATSYKDILLLGLNLNAHFTDYTRYSSVYESNNNNSSQGVQKIKFENELFTYGNGFSFNLGTIVKVSDSFRLGLAYESPTWSKLNDELTQSLSTVHIGLNGTGTETSVVNPNVTNIYQPYKIKTPGKFTFSSVAIINKKGLISIDVTSKDYSNTKFKPTNDEVFAPLNSQLKNNLKSTISYNIGGEYKIKRFSLRGGYRFEESPYKIDYTLGDLSGYSAGLGYSFSDSRLDIAYAKYHRSYNSAFISSGMNDTSRIDNTNTSLTVTYSISF